ncbi:MAG: hypothetical protein OEM49_06865, partial [Myxococcales bacterium]|nr:hypothetical protein [Myxococcales bacterium]
MSAAKGARKRKPRPPRDGASGKPRETSEPRTLRASAPPAERFRLVSEYEPTGDQPRAIAQLVEGIGADAAHQTLLGVTGSGKSFTVACVVEQINRPT